MDKIYLQFDFFIVKYIIELFLRLISSPSLNNVPRNKENKQTKENQIEHNSVMAFLGQCC